MSWSIEDSFHNSPTLELSNFLGLAPAPRAHTSAGRLETRSEHKFRYYTARREALGELAQVLERMWDDALWRLKLAAELEQTRRGPRPPVDRGVGLAVKN